MKLRLRSTASKETLKIDVPSDCTLPLLKKLIADRIGVSSASASHITVSLNRKDELVGAPDVPLSSLGVASGDLLFFYTIDLTQDSSDAAESSRCEVGMIDCGNSEGVDDEAKVVDEAADGRMDVEQEALDVNVKETLKTEEESGDGVDEENMNVVDADILTAKRQSMPLFLKNAWKDGNGQVLSGYQLLVVALQAVLVESGFVRLNSDTDAPVYDFYVPDGEIPARTLTLRYTVADLIESNPEFVTVKMFKQGHDLLVYGDISGNKNHCYTLRLDETRARNMEFELQKNNEAAAEDSEGVFLNERHDNEVFKFYKEVKDGLALPLLIDICDKARLPQPICLMRLPTELKLKIFELVSGADLAKLACQCSEFQYLTSDNSLWKMKYVNEFGNGGGDESTNWKQKFVSSWKRARATKDRENMFRHNRLARSNSRFRNLRPPPFGAPFIIGGDYDLHPFGDVGPYTAPFGSSSGRGRQPYFPYPSFQPSRRFSPNRGV